MPYQGPEFQEFKPESLSDERTRVLNITRAVAAVNLHLQRLELSEAVNVQTIEDTEKGWADYARSTNITDSNSDSVASFDRTIATNEARQLVEEAHQPRPVNEQITPTNEPQVFVGNDGSFEYVERRAA